MGASAHTGIAVLQSGEFCALAEKYVKKIKQIALIRALINVWG
jgi:hypothetical protein